MSWCLCPSTGRERCLGKWVLSEDGRVGADASSPEAANARHGRAGGLAGETVSDRNGKRKPPIADLKLNRSLLRTVSKSKW